MTYSEVRRRQPVVEWNHFDPTEDKNTRLSVDYTREYDQAGRTVGVQLEDLHFEELFGQTWVDQELPKNKEEIKDLLSEMLDAIFFGGARLTLHDPKNENWEWSVTVKSDRSANSDKVCAFNKDVREESKKTTGWFVTVHQIAKKIELSTQEIRAEIVKGNLKTFVGPTGYLSVSGDDFVSWLKTIEQTPRVEKAIKQVEKEISGL